MFATRIAEPHEHRTTRREIERRTATIERCAAPAGMEFDFCGALFSIAERGLGGGSAAQQRVHDLSGETTAVYGPGQGQLRLPIEFLARDLLTSAGTGGGYTVGSGARPPDSEIMEALRPVSLAARLGVPIWSGIRGWGSLTLPQVATNAPASWVAENVAASPASVIFGAGITLVPSLLTLNCAFSRKLRSLSSANVDQFVRAHLLGSVMSEIDRALFAGNGSGAEPTGLLYSTSVTVESLGAAGGAPALANLAAMEKAVGDANGQDLAFVTNPAVRSKLRRTGDTFGNPLWTESDRAAGMRAYASSALPSNLTKSTGSNLSAGIVGDFARGALVALYGSVDLIVPPATDIQGNLRVTVLADVAIGIVRPNAFCVFKDAVTT